MAKVRIGVLLFDEAADHLKGLLEAQLNKSSAALELPFDMTSFIKDERDSQSKKH